MNCASCDFHTSKSIMQGLKMHGQCLLHGTINHGNNAACSDWQAETGDPVITIHARAWLIKTNNRPGCQCHKCRWAHNVIAGITAERFEDR